MLHVYPPLHALIHMITNDKWKSNLLHAEGICEWGSWGFERGNWCFEGGNWCFVDWAACHKDPTVQSWVKKTTQNETDYGRHEGETARLIGWFRTVWILIEQEIWIRIAWYMQPTVRWMKTRFTMGWWSLPMLRSASNLSHQPRISCVSNWETTSFQMETQLPSQSWM